MLATDLIKYEPSLKYREGAFRDFDVESISHVDNPVDRTFIFIKKKKFLNAVGRFSDSRDFSKVGIVFQLDLYDSLSSEEIREYSERYAWLATVDNVDHAMCRLSKPFYQLKFDHLNYFLDGRQIGSAEVHPEAEIAQGVFIGDHCKIGSGTKIMPGCVILPHVEIGENTLVFPNVNIYPYTTIGNNCRIHSGTVIGTDGFGYNFFEGAHHKIWHIGGVTIGNETEIGCNTMIDAGTFSPTRIGDHTRIDNDVQISHNVRVDNHVVICGKTGLAGSVWVKDYCAFGAGAGVAPSAILENGVQVAARAVVSENAQISQGEIVAGHPARPLKEWLRTQAKLRGLTKK